MSENYHGVSVRSETTMTDDLKARLDALHVWPQAVADAYAAELTPRQIDKLYAVGKVATEAADRIATLEAALADMTRQRDAAIKSLADVREETIRLNTATDAQYAKTVAKLREERDAAMAGAVKVRELVWEDVDALCTRQKAPALGGHYSVVEFDANTEEAHFATNIDLGGLAFVFILEPDPLGGRRPKRYSTIEAAKAAAQRDYEARILAALTPDPDRLLALTAVAYEDATDLVADDYVCDAIRNRSPANALAALAALSRIEAQAEARGMRKAVAEIAPLLSSALASQEAAHTEGFANAMGERADGIELSIRRISALADATEAAAKGGV